MLKRIRAFTDKWRWYIWGVLCAIAILNLVQCFWSGHISITAAPSVAAPAAPTTVTIDGKPIVIPPGSTLVYDSHTTHTGAVSTKTTDRNASYIDWSSAASIAGAMAENVDWKGLATDPLVLGVTGGLAGVFGIFAKLVHSNGRSKGRNEIRAAMHGHPTTKPSPPTP